LWDAIAYRPAAGRDLRLDFLRGFAVFAMVVDHLGGPSPLQLLTGGNRFITSAAEGFVCISGLLVGLVYHRVAERDGLGTSIRRLLERALQLYVLAVGLTLILLPLSEMLDLPWAQGIDLRDPLALIMSIVTLHRTYYLVDVTLLYSLLLLLAPLALALMADGRSWVVLAISWLIWAGYQRYPEFFDFTWPIEGNYLFIIASWQVLFFTPMVLGFHRQRLFNASLRSQRILLALFGAGLVAILVLFHQLDPLLRDVQAVQGPIEGGSSVSLDILELVFSKGDVRIGRLVASVVVFGFLFLLTSACWVPLRRGLGWLLLPLGQNALYAYSVHVVVAAMLGLPVVQDNLVPSSSPKLSALLQLLGIGAILLAIRLRLLQPRRAHLRYWMASPIAVACGLLILLPTDPTPDLPGLAAAPTPQQGSSSTRAAHLFGTPVTRASVLETGARLAMTPVPLPPPAADLQPAPLVASDQPPASEFIGQTHGTFKELQFYSGALDRDMPYFLYLPPRYGTEGRRYPVLYMLHGGSADKGEWPAYGLVEAVDTLIDSKELHPMMVVMPQGDFSYWMNHVNGGPRWGDYVAFDLVRHIDASFRTLPDPDHRAIGGLSMGGHGALQLAFNHPDVFGVVGAHSPSLHPQTGLQAIAGEGEAFAQRDPITLAEHAPGLEHLQIWLDIGEDDPWRPRAQLLHDTLDQRGIEHTWQVLSGGHNGEYWERNLVTYLRYYDGVLN
jgi:enterochelin esterase-like enzyme